MCDLFILIVSDDINFKDYLSNYLLMDGNYVETADQLDNARRMLKNMKYDLVIIRLNSFKDENNMLSAKEVHRLPLRC